MRSIEQFAVGQSHKIVFDVDEALIERFATFSGDWNPLHIDREIARKLGHPRQVAHGVITVAILSRLIGMDLPGPGALWMGQTIEWLAPVYPGDRIELEATIAQVSVAARVLVLKISAVNQKGVTVMSGQSRVGVADTRADNAADSVVGERVALVIGGSRGVGAAIARKLAAEGIKVAVNCRPDSAAGRELVGSLKAEGFTASLAASDVGAPGGASLAVSQTLSEFGRLDIVVHCATPPTIPVDAAELRYADLEPYLRTYLGAATEIVSGALPGMKERKFGRFVFIGTSYLFGQPPPGLGAYVAAKSALWGLTRSLATELGPFGITANMVSPSMISTELTGHISPRVKEVEARKSPMRRLADVQDAANAVVSLTAEGAGYINGVNLPLTGGPV